MEEVKKDMNKASDKLSFKKDKDTKKKKEHGADFGLRIIAVIAAVITWFTLSITQYPTVNKTITNVPVDFSMSGTQAEDKGLSALNYKDISVDVEIKGMNYEIGNYTANDLIATVNLDNVTKEGTYDLEIVAKSSHSTDRCTIVSVTPDTIKIDFDRITTKKVPLDVEAPLVSAEEGYTLKESTVTPSEITVEGPENALNEIDKGAAQISKSKKLSQDTTIAAEDIVFYDADDNKLDSSKFTIKDNKSFDINFVIYKKKTAKLNVDVTGCPDDFDVSSLPISYSEEEIPVITPQLDDTSTEKITIGSIQLSQIKLGGVFQFTVPLPTGEINMGGTDTIAVTIDSDDYISKSFTLSNITAVNTPTGLKAEIETKSIPGITLIGPADEINSITNDDLTATVDSSKVGSYSQTALISVKGHNKIWSYGNYEAQVVVTAPSSSSDS